MSRNYIPTNKNDFNNFQLNVNNQVTANATTWNIPGAEATALNNWSMGYDPLYKNVLNKNTRTRQQVIAHDEYRADYVAFLRSFCQGFLVNNTLIPISERAAMGLNPRGLNPRSERPEILGSPIPSLKPLGGGMVQFTFKVADSNSRTARHPDSNGVEVYYKLEPQSVGQPVVLNDELIEEEGSGTMADDDNGFKNMFSTRARFVNELGIDNIGKRLTVYARWVNTSDPVKNGPYSATTSMVVS